MAKERTVRSSLIISLVLATTCSATLRERVCIFSIFLMKWRCTSATTGMGAIVMSSSVGLMR